MTVFNNVTMTVQTADAAVAIGPNDIVVATPIVVPKVRDRNTAYNAIIDLVQKRETWQATTYARSNADLYVVLQYCYAVYLAMVSDEDVAKLWKSAFDDYMAANNIGVKNSTHTLTKIVRCVFAGDRRRVSAYGLALRAAYDAKTPVVDLPDFFTSNGGIEEIRLSRSTATKTPKQKAEAAAQTVNQSVLANVRLNTTAETFDPAKVGSQHVLIVTQKADGSYDVNALLSNASAVNAALVAFYSQNKAQEDAAAVSEAQTRADNALTASIDVAAQSALQ